MEELTCPNCNAPLESENQFARTLTCKYCGSSYLVPDWASLPPAGEATSLGDASFKQNDSNCRSTEPQAVISGLTPLPPKCVLREAQDKSARTLTITGTHFPTIHHGLQFSRVDDGRLSLIFDMEVNWGSTTCVTVDMARIKHALWDDARLLLRVRLMDTEDTNYQPLSNWSTEFILVDNATTY